MSDQLFIPEISPQTFLDVQEDVRQKLSWHESQYKELAIQLFQTWWGDTNTGDLSFEITLSLCTEGRSSVDVLNLTFVGTYGQQATFIIRIYPTGEAAAQEKNIARKLTAPDCFPDLIPDELYQIPEFVVYRDVSDNVGSSVLGLHRFLVDELLSKSEDEIGDFARGVREFAQLITIQYQQVEGRRYSTEACLDYYKNIRSQLPPDLVIKGACLDELSSQVFAVQSQNQDESLSTTEAEQLQATPISQLIERVNNNNAKSQWLKMLVQRFDNADLLTGKGNTAYLSFRAQDIRIWVGIDKEVCTPPHLELGKQYTFIFCSKDIVTFTSLLQEMKFASEACLANTEFQALLQHKPVVHTVMRHNDLHCDNVLASLRRLKAIDLGDMKPNLIASDIARLEVSLWFEISKQLQISKEEVEAILYYLARADEEPVNHDSPYVFTLSLIIRNLRDGFKKGVWFEPEPFEMELAYVIQILLYQRYCLLDGLAEIPPAFNLFACHKFKQFRYPQQIAQEIPELPVLKPAQHIRSKAPGRVLNVVNCAENLIRRYQTVSDTFTPLFLRADQRTMPTIQVTPATMLWSHRGLLDMPDGQLSGENEERITPLMEVINTHPILVLRGDPGTGKTTSCRFLAYLAATRLLESQHDSSISPLPVFVELNRFTVQSNESAEDGLARLIAMALRHGGALAATSNIDASQGHYWLTQAEQGQALTLYLDGLNEVAPAYRNAADDALKLLAEKLRGSPSCLVITTRRYGFEVMRLGSLKLYDIQPLSATAIKQYLQTRLEWTQEQVEELYHEKLGARLQLQSSNPLLLNLLCDVLQQGEEPPSSRGELFRIFVQGILERWEMSQATDFGQRHFSSEQKHRGLEYLAFCMQTEGRAIAVSRTVMLFQQILQINEERATALLKELYTNHLLREHHDATEFAHHTLQEYFCASALRRLWRGATTHDKVNWTPNFEGALSDPRWWEPLAMVGGLLGRRDLDDFVAGLKERPILTGMVLGNAKPKTQTEFRFVRQTAEKIRSGINRIIIRTQAALLGITSVCIVIAGTIFWMNSNGNIPSLSSLLGINPLDGLPTSFALVPFIASFVIGFWLMSKVTNTIRLWHDQLLDKNYERRVEPWLLALYYTNSPIAERKLEEILSSYKQQRFVDEALRARLRAFSVRAMSQEIEELLADLETPDRYRFAISILSLEFDSSLAFRLLHNLESQSPIRQTAEIELYLAWLRRHQSARERFLPDLENWVLDTEHNYSLRWHLVRQLRKSGLSKVKIGFNMGWILRLIGKSLKSLPQLPKIIWSWVMSIPFFFLVVPLALIPDRFSKISGLGWRFLGKLVSFPFIRPVSWLLSEIWEKSVNVLIDAKKVEEAEKLLQQALKRFPNNVALLFSQGNLFHYIHENYVEAIKSYRTALKLQPNEAYLLRSLANSLRLAGELEESEQVARRALKIAPDNAISWKRLVDVLMDKGQMEEGENLLEQALNRFSNNDNILYSKTKYMLTQGNFSEALQTITLALKAFVKQDGTIATSPLNLEEWNLIKAETLLHLKQQEEALVCLITIEKPIDIEWLRYLSCIAKPDDMVNFDTDPLISRLYHWTKEEINADIIHSLHPIPQTGISRISRQTCLWLQAELLERANIPESTDFRQQAESLSCCDLIRIKALLSLLSSKRADNEYF